MKSQLKIDSRVTLSDGNIMPLLGLGVWDAKSGKETYDSVIHALNQDIGISILQKCTVTKEMSAVQL